MRRPLWGLSARVRSAFDPYKFLRDGGRRQTKNNYMMWGADDSGRVPLILPRRTTSAASTNTSWHGSVQRRGARGVVSGERRCRQDLLRERPVMGRGCERFAAFSHPEDAGGTEGCAGIEDGRAVGGPSQARGPQVLKLREPAASLRRGLRASADGDAFAASGGYVVWA